MLAQPLAQTESLFIYDIAVQANLLIYLVAGVRFLQYRTPEIVPVMVAC